MIHGLEALRHGFDAQADVVVIGSGPGGAVAARNLARAGLRTVVLEAGPEVRPEDMTRDAPLFLARNTWEGGTRAIGGSAQIPSIQGRCVGGSSVMNSAIMMRLPDWVRRLWIEEDGLDWLRTDALDHAYARIYARLSVTDTPEAVMGERSLIARDAFATVGLPGAPLPRAVKDCEGAADCLTGCHGGRKQSVDRTYLRDALDDGATVYTCAQVERILVQSGRAVGVSGHVVDPRGQRPLATFTVRAPRVVVAGGAAQTPALLAFNGLTAHGTVGSSFAAHIGVGLLAYFAEPVDPWIGATQGWGAVCPDIPGLKFESLWAPPSLIAVRWGDLGLGLLERLPTLKNTTLVGLVYRGKVTGTVRPRANGLPRMRLDIPDAELLPVMAGARLAVDAFFNVGAEAVHLGIARTPERLETREQAYAVLEKRWRARDIAMTANHIFGSCPMSSDLERGAVDPQGRLRDVEGIWVTDASLFPSPSAVNPQATVMALSDVITRRLGELALEEPPA